jgi:hypothetical protein
MESPELDPGYVQEIYLVSKAFKLAVWPNHHPIQWVPGALFMEVKRPGRKADH